MTYVVRGLSPEPFAPLFGLGEAELAARGAIRRTVDLAAGYPCRIALEDAAPGESVILVNHVSHDAATPFRSAYAIYVREGEQAAAEYVDAPPPLFSRRTLGLRGFDSQGMLRGALLAAPGEADARIREFLERPEIAEIHAHNAAAGCFLARVGRL